MTTFSNINDALKEYSSGKIIIVMDDETRENEGDIVINARFASKENITFIKNNTSGILCAVITPDKAKRLELNPMVEKNTDNHQHLIKYVHKIKTN
jgi:3,4-dihydroxy 2-butanone 4-phosphate synthase/GTP cyclohydrolase II